MADSGAAYDPDRLPWLSDERKPRRKRGPTALLLWALLAALLVAGGSYWLGMQSVSEPGEVADSVRTSRPAATVRLPEAAIVAPPAQEVQPAPMPEVQPVAQPAPVRIPQAEPARKAKAQSSRRVSARPKARVVVHRARPRAAPARKRAAAARPAAMQAWPASVSEGAYGRVVRIGAYSNRRQAKLGWWGIVRRYPGMRRLKAVVAPVQSSRTGRTYYRLQFGTTSQAHSEVLCQRMRVIARSCTVIGLPGRPAGARR